MKSMFQSSCQTAAIHVLILLPASCVTPLQLLQASFLVPRGPSRCRGQPPTSGVRLSERRGGRRRTSGPRADGGFGERRVLRRGRQPSKEAAKNGSLVCSFVGYSTFPLMRFGGELHRQNDPKINLHVSRMRRLLIPGS